MNLELLFLFCAGLSFSNGQLTVGQVNTIKTYINQAIDDSYDEFLRTHPLIAGAVRLAFHDCVGPEGCNGCVNHDDPENAGLRFYTDMLDPIYDLELSSLALSRADFYALSSITALERAAEFANCFPNITNITACWPQLTFRYGRPDCLTSPESIDFHDFPDAHKGVDSQINYFKSMFNFTQNETVAILGAHTLGRGHTENAGWEGRWVGNPDALNNAFYHDMQDAGWRWIHLDNTPPPFDERHFQWEAARGGEAMMLNSDMGLFLNQTPEADGYVDCEWHECTASATREQVLVYAFDNEAWIWDFAAVFNKLIENKNSNLALPTP